MLKIKTKLKLFLRPNGKVDFLNSIPKNSYILDVGCGNNSPLVVKSFLPNSYYVGIDVDNYNNDYDVEKVADEYILSDPNDFVKSLKSINSNFDAIISSHNLEHCNDRMGVLDAMIDKLNYKGKIYLSFPSKKSVYFPQKIGCLNYYDDPTHKDLPPDFDLILEILKEKKLKVIFSKANYKPLLLSYIGIFSNLISFFTQKVHIGMYEIWGFESIIIAENNNTTRFNCG
tara:strand:+ start:67 stop:753 length:687 start_codon:yes stop_codon:yes gene_type:complete